MGPFEFLLRWECNLGPAFSNVFRANADRVTLPFCLAGVISGQLNAVQSTFGSLVDEILGIHA